MGEWKEVKLDDYLEATSSKRIFAKEYVESGIPFYRSKEIIEKEYGKEINKPLYISIDRFNEIKNKFGIPTDGDILISAVGERSGIPYVVKNDGNFYFKDGNLIWLKDFKKDLLSDFLYRWFKSKNGQHILFNSMIGSAQRALTIQGIKNLVIQVPPLNEQKAIAEVLSSLDDKIDLLHRQNKTLEELAQILFRQWFVEDAKGEWEECKLSDVLEIKYGKDHKKLADGNIPLYGSGGVMRYVDSFLYDKESILIPRKGTLTNLFYIDEPFWTVDTIFWSKINTEKVSGKFLFSFLKTMDLSNLNVGSAVPSLTTKVLNEIKLRLPSIDEQKQFNEYADSAWKKMGKNKDQIKTLENMRDTLLPKLMSGEVRVRI